MAHHVVTRVEPRYAVDVPKGWAGDAVEKTLYVKLRLTQIIASPAAAGVDLPTAARDMLTYDAQRNVTIGPAPGLREAFFAAVRTVRPVSGQDLKLSPEFAAAAKTYLDLVAAPGGASDHR